MPSFRTEIIPAPSTFRISHETKMLLTGSCFAVNLGSAMKELLFPVRINPFGVVYNPLSILNTLGILLDEVKYSKDDLEYYNELWFSFDHHSSFSHTDAEECLRQINQELEISSPHLKESHFLLITFGTAWIYKLKKAGKIVSNCHKVPASEFDRILLEPDDIILAWMHFLDELFSIYPEMKVIFTVSPVRHWKDGAHGNQLSKSVLLLAIEKLCNIFPGKTEYFPAYEILLDDLRDYRFFDNDLLHPNSQAIEYIQSKFSQIYFDTKTIELNLEIAKLVKAKSHRVFNENTASFQKFKSSQKSVVKKLSAKYPFLDLSDFMKHFS